MKSLRLSQPNSILVNMPSDEQKKDESKVENHVNHDDKPEEPQKDEDTTQDGNEDDVLPISQVVASGGHSGKL